MEIQYGRTAATAIVARVRGHGQSSSVVEQVELKK